MQSIKNISKQEIIDLVDKIMINDKPDTHSKTYVV